MLRGQSQPGSQSGRGALGWCKRDIEDQVIDVDVVIVDEPETSRRGSGGVINIDDEDGDTDDRCRDVHGCDTSKTSSHSYSAEESGSDERPMLIRKRKFPYKSTKKMGIFHENGSFRNCICLDLSSESSASEDDNSSSCASARSESDSSDCEIIEDSLVREQWERAALRKRPFLKVRFDSNASGSFADPISSSPETTHNQVCVDSFTNINYLNNREDVPVKTSPSNSSNVKENVFRSVSTAGSLAEEPLIKPNVNNISSSVPTADELTEEHPLETDVNPCIADLDSTSGTSLGELGFQNEEPTSEECSHRVQSTDEILLDHMTTDVEVQMQEPFSYNSRLGHDGHNGASFHYKKDQISGDPSYESISQCDLGVDHEVFGLRGKYRSNFEPSLYNSQFPSGPQPHAGSEEATLRESNCNNHAGSRKTEMGLSSDKESGGLPLLVRDLIDERERGKESDEDKHFSEEEWATKTHQLKIQAEEARQVRKRRNSEILLLDMERRQKQRLEEIRESQRKGEETINLKEKLRAEVRKELGHIELGYMDMASLLRRLGIHVEGGLYPLSHEVNAAYKRALLRFHPDRSSRLDIRQQVEAEEKFKLISCLKEELLRTT